VGIGLPALAGTRPFAYFAALPCHGMVPAVERTTAMNSNQLAREQANRMPAVLVPTFRCVALDQSPV
jgi:hypothetical protein